MNEILTMRDLVALEVIATAAERCARVARVLPSGTPVYGTARSIGNDRGAFLGRDEDVRDGYLRVTTREGFETFWPVRELMPLVHSGEFTEYDWRDPVTYEIGVRITE